MVLVVTPPRAQRGRTRGCTCASAQRRRLFRRRAKGAGSRSSRCGEKQHCGGPQRHIEGVGAEDVSESETDGSNRCKYSGSDDGASLTAKLGREPRYEEHGGCRSQRGIEVNGSERSAERVDDDPGEPRKQRRKIDVAPCGMLGAGEEGKFVSMESVATGEAEEEYKDECS